MRKHVRPVAPPGPEPWQKLQDDVEVELTSEDPERPIEGALLGEESGGWRAGGPGRQTITLTWPAPIAIRRIRLVFEEHSQGRTQEFVVRAPTRDGHRELVRQQFTFSPPGTTVECEEYATNLDGVSQLELAIIPAIDGRHAVDFEEVADHIKRGGLDATPSTTVQDREQDVSIPSAPNAAADE